MNKIDNPTLSAGMNHPVLMFKQSFLSLTPTHSPTTQHARMPHTRFVLSNAAFEHHVTDISVLFLFVLSEPLGEHLRHLGAYCSTTEKPAMVRRAPPCTHTTLPPPPLLLLD